jgi:hypothetical protein
MAIDPFKALVSVVTAINFEMNRDRLGLVAAVDRLRESLLLNDLWIAGDDAFLAAILTGEVSPVEIAASLCSELRLQATGSADVN